MIRLALSFVRRREVAEEVVQDTWLGLLRGLDRFEGRSSLQTWLYRILVNRARTTGAREQRSVTVADAAATVDAAAFGRDGSWAAPPAPWVEDVDDRLSAPALKSRILELIELLPSAQRQVVTLRDVQGLSSVAVCDVLDITDGNQRVLLHRARTWVRQMLADDMSGW
jgi:RNA polymerase sigma-70 factor (ECF subfamily)